MQASVNLIPMSMTYKQAKEIIGSLSKPSKMPAHGYSISAKICNVGQRLRKIADSVCADCYALKGNYRFKNVQDALANRLKAFANPVFPDAMALVINTIGESHFRWFDSGDLQHLDMLVKIARVAELTPDTLHWLPTREYLIVDKYLEIYGEFPSNLTVRVSAQRVNHTAPPRFDLTSQVHDGSVAVADNVYKCPAPQQDNKCGYCRACWNNEVPTISYRKH